MSLMSAIELVLSSLVEKFAFKPGPSVTWEMSGISRPTVPETGDLKTKLPLNVAILN